MGCLLILVLAVGGYIVLGVPGMILGLLASIAIATTMK